MVLIGVKNAEVLSLLNSLCNLEQKHRWKSIYRWYQVTQGKSIDISSFVQSDSLRSRQYPGKDQMISIYNKRKKKKSMPFFACA